MFRENGVIRAHKGPGSGRRNAGLSSQVRISPLHSCQAAEPRPRRRKPEGQNSPSFDLTRPAPPSPPTSATPMLPNPAIVLRRETARSGPEPCRFLAKHCHVPGKGGNPGSYRARIWPGECRSPRPGQDLSPPFGAGCGSLLRRRKTKGRKGPSFHLTHPAPHHPLSSASPMLPYPALVHRRETARSTPKPCRFLTKHCHVPGKRGNPGSCRTRI